MVFKYKHLISINQTYSQHFLNAMSYSLLSQKASILFFIHAVYPDTFTDDGSKTIKSLYDKISTSNPQNEKCKYGVKQITS